MAKCSDDSIAVRAVAVGIRSAIIQCHEQFKDRKWTCLALATKSNENLFGAFISESESSRQDLENCTHMFAILRQLVCAYMQHWIMDSWLVR